jgi:hypothetical protein
MRKRALGAGRQPDDAVGMGRADEVQILLMGEDQVGLAIGEHAGERVDMGRDRQRHRASPRRDHAQIARDQPDAGRPQKRDATPLAGDRKRARDGEHLIAKLAPCGGGRPAA